MIKIYKHILIFVACSSTFIQLHINTQLLVKIKFVSNQKEIGIFVVFIYTRENVEIKEILSC